MKTVIFIAKAIQSIYRWCLKLLHPQLAKRIREIEVLELGFQRRFSPSSDLFTKFSAQNKKSILEEWNNKVNQTFDPNQSQAFYRGWVGEMGVLNLMTNVYDQTSRFELFLKLNDYIPENCRLLDYGCGSAALSMSFSRKVKELTLLDVPNLPADYVKFKISSMKLNNVTWGNVLEYELPADGQDVVMCIDVLEHLENSFAVFQNVHASLKQGGILFLQAPWGGIPEHIDEAISNWKTNSGPEFLDRHYDKLATINPLIPMKPYSISGIYRKR